MFNIIRKLDFQEEDEFKRKSYIFDFFDLGITSVKTAILLNFFLEFKLNNCPKKRGYVGCIKNCDSVVGGGLFVKAEPRITITDLNNVGIYFQLGWKVRDFIRIPGPMKEDLRKAIFGKLVKELKDMWYYNNGEEGKILPLPIEYLGRTEYCGKYKYNDRKFKFEFLNIDDSLIVKSNKGERYIEISKEEFNTLCDYFKGHSRERIIKDHGEKAYNIMIGKKIEDRFVLNAIKDIKEDVIKVLDSFTVVREDLNSQEMEEVTTLKEKYSKLSANAADEYQRKILDLQEKMNEVIKMSKLIPGIL